MANPLDNRYMTQSRSAAAAADIDVGLRQYMLKVYNYMSVGLVVTGLIALLVSEHSDVFYAVTMSPLRWVVMFAPLGFALMFGFRIQQMRAATAEILYWAFAAIMGLSLSYIFVVYQGPSIARVFFITAGTFAGMSLYGYTTKRDLSGMGSFLFMGLWGIILAMVVNWFMQSAALDFTISLIGVAIFVGLTAWDTQKIKEMYSAGDGAEVATKKAIYGAFQLYLDFLNMFLFLLRLMGNRR
jgi:uncharacterized protein